MIPIQNRMCQNAPLNFPGLLLDESGRGIHKYLRDEAIACLLAPNGQHAGLSNIVERSRLQRLLDFLTIRRRTVELSHGHIFIDFRLRGDNDLYRGPVMI